MNQFEMEDVTRAALSDRGRDLATHLRQREALHARHADDGDTAVVGQPRFRMPHVGGLAHGFRLAHWHR